MISFSQKVLREALTGLRVLKVSKLKLPVLQCVLVHGAGTTVSFEATTLDEHLRFVGAGETDAPATQLVPYELLADALKSADADSAITINPDAISYFTGGAKLTVPLPEHKLEDFPPAPIAKGEPITLPEGVIGSMVEAQSCASTDPSRYILNSVLLSPHEVVATDGRQLYSRNGLGLALPKGGVIFPVSGVPGVLDAGQPADLWVWDLEESPKARISQGFWQWSTKLVSGSYPNYRQVIPKQETYRDGSTIRIADADATRLLSVLPRMPGFKESSSPVRLSITANGAELSPPARLPQVVVALERSEVLGPRPNAVQFNASFLLSALKRGFRELCIKDEVSPLVMRDHSRINLWMPVRSEAAPVPSAPAEPEASPVPVQSNPPTETQPQSENNNMVSPNSSHTPESPVAQPAAKPAFAARICATPDQVAEYGPLDTLLRAKELLREVQAAISDASNAIRDLAKEKRAVAKDLEALKGKLRSLKAVEV